MPTKWVQFSATWKYEGFSAVVASYDQGAGVASEASMVPSAPLSMVRERLKVSSTSRPRAAERVCA